jgi:hypothetical protein
MGIEVILRAGLIDVVAQSGGICYRVNDSGVSFLGLLEAPYVEMLKGRAAWLATQVDVIASDSDMRRSLAESLGHWSIEFVGTDTGFSSLNAIPGSEE